jgi:hypothetical protein
MNYIDLAKYFDLIGRYKSADKIEKFIREAQQVNFEQSTTGKPNFGGNVTNTFDATAMGKKTQGITPELETGPGRDTVMTFNMPNFEEKQRLFKTKEGVEYFNEVMQGFKENILQVAAGLGLQGLSNRINAIKGALNGVPATLQAEYYINNFDPIITNDLIRILLTEEVFTFINALRYVYDNVNYGNKVLVSTIPNAISQGMQQLRDIAVRSNDQRVLDKYNAAIQDPYIAQFYQA